MVKELYTRDVKDPNYVPGVIEHTNTIEMIIGKLQMILGTKPTDVFGAVDFGIGIEDIVFSTRLSNVAIEEKIRKQIAEYIPETSKHNIDVKVSFGIGDGYDYCIIDLYIDSEKVIGIMVN